MKINKGTEAILLKGKKILEENKNWFYDRPARETKVKKNRIL